MLLPAGSVTHSTPYNNLTLYNLTANTGEASERGFALFPASEAPCARLARPAAPAVPALLRPGWLRSNTLPRRGQRSCWHAFTTARRWRPDSKTYCLTV